MKTEGLAVLEAVGLSRNGILLPIPDVKSWQILELIKFHLSGACTPRDLECAAGLLLKRPEHYWSAGQIQSECEYHEPIERILVELYSAEIAPPSPSPEELRAYLEDGSIPQAWEYRQKQAEQVRDGNAGEAV